eukprot:TRINITY_DN2208_c0_g1_i1.p1 TRINITY_DN2208_c0_g1~~TRINITY_DN2208_c0_g1_i1.p1  ORF type:complete len:234 (+),score=47.46 TRINITY_DN2208_c0_g1_i1:203-904(+)
MNFHKGLRSLKNLRTQGLNSAQLCKDLDDYINEGVHNNTSMEIEGPNRIVIELPDNEPEPEPEPVKEQQEPPFVIIDESEEEEEQEEQKKAKLKLLSDMRAIHSSLPRQFEPLGEDSFSIESQDETDDLVVRKHRNRAINEFEGLNDCDRDFMRCWNEYIQDEETALSRSTTFAKSFPSNNGCLKIRKFIDQRFATIRNMRTELANHLLCQLQYGRISHADIPYLLNYFDSKS